MVPDDLESDVAAAAHRCWCDRMAAHGWKYGAVYDEAARTHDALRPFESLDDRDRRAAMVAVRAMELVRLLACAVDYPRGPEREFTADEMRVGLPVVMAPGPGRDVPEADRGVVDADRGVVDSWEADPSSGVLLRIRVRWRDGQVSDHHPAALELRRA